MTTKVNITHEGPDHHDVVVEVFNPATGSPGYGTCRLKIGQGTGIHVHSGSAIYITEVAKIVPPIGVTVVAAEVKS